jgi:hypothetical protein
MKNLSKPIVLILICVSTIILASLACNFPRNESKNLSLAPRAEDGSVSGSYTWSGSSDDKVNFTVATDGFATFRLDGAPEAETLYVDLKDEQTANLAWNGTTLDGLGALTDEEQAALEDLMNSNLTHGLGMIPLDIACQGDENIEAKQVAALLFPLQIRYKYAVTKRWTQSQELIALSQCDYGSGEKTGNNDTSLIMLSSASPVPVVFGYFPFDTEGATESTRSSFMELETACLATSTSWMADGPFPYNLLGSGPETISSVRTNEWGPCEAMCRGACGADCEPNNCKTHKEQRCEKDDEGGNTGMVVQYLIYECGMHQGCIDHDNCYDRCNEEYGCDSWAATACRHLWTLDPTTAISLPHWWCDQKAVTEHGPIYPPLWMEGYGPQPMQETFEYFDEEYGKQQDLEKCPLDSDEAESPPADEGERIPVGTYVGTTDYPQFLAKILSPGQYSTNEAIIHIAEDGTVTGSFSIYYIGDTFVREDNGCVKHWEAEISGSFSGQLTGNHGTITSTEKWSCVLFADCSDTGECDEGPIIRQIEIRVSGDHMTGDTLPHPEDPDGLMNWTLNATKE